MKFIRQEEANQKVGVRTTTFMEMVREGLLPKPIKLSRAKLYVEHELDEALKKLAADPEKRAS